MGITAIVLIFLLGIALILLEIFAFPGVGIAGVAGFFSVIYAIYRAFLIDTTTGVLTMVLGLGVSLLSLGLAFRYKTWERFSVKNELKTKLNLVNEQLIKKGMTGKSISRINPVGKAAFGNEIIEVQSIAGFINENIDVQIVDVNGSKVRVKAIA